ncbi:MAG: WD40 repeat domain-containing protein [Gemmataceae bacterium]
MASWQAGVLYCLAYSPDGKRLAGAGRDGRLYVWDATTGREREPARPHPQEINAIAWSPDGTWLATACEDGIVRIWPAEGRQPIEFVGHDKKVKAIAVSPDGRTVASGGYDGTVRVWDVAERSCTVIERKSPINVVAFSPDGASLIVGNEPKLTTWDARSGRLLTEGPDHETAVTALCIGPGQTVASASVQLAVVSDRDPPGSTRRVHHQLPLVPGKVSGMAFGSDGATLVTATDEGVTVWDLDGPKRRGTLCADGGRVRAVAAHPTRPILATAGDDGTVRLWDIATVGPVRPLPFDSKSVLALGWLPDRPVCVAAANRDRLHAWACDTEEPQTFELTPPTKWSGLPVAFGRDGSIVAAETGCVRRWQIPGGKVHLVLARPGLALKGGPGEEQCNKLAVSPDGRWTAAAINKDAVIADAATGQQLAPLSGHRKNLTTVTFSPDSSLLATGDIEGCIGLWELPGGVQRHFDIARNGATHALAFAPDGLLLASGGRDRAIHLWDLSGRELRKLVGHTGEVCSLAFAADGRTLVSGGADGTVRFWQAATGSELLTVPVSEEPVEYLAFNPDGRHLAVAAASRRRPERAIVHLFDAGQTPRIRQ